MSKPKFMMMVGLPGSGKSTLARNLAEAMNAIILSSDQIRKELLGDENSQENNEKVFAILHREIKNNLKAGNNVIMDSTNISSKRRRAFLRELKNISCCKECMIVATPFTMCLDFNKARDRVVPYEVIKRMYMNWNTPYSFEGWDIIYSFHPNHYKQQSINDWLVDYMDFDQDNLHHSHSLGKHCLFTGKEFLWDKDETLLEAALLHDCGKPFTKSFKNSKGEDTETAHYYRHENVGAYDSLFFEYSDGVEALDVSILINLHMQPYFWEREENSEKIAMKYKKLWGEELFNKVMKLHEADKNAH